MNNIVHFRGIDLYQTVLDYQAGNYSGVTQNIPVKMMNLISTPMHKIVEQPKNKIKTITNEFKREYALLSYMPDEKGNYTPYNCADSMEREFNCMYCLAPIMDKKNILGIPIVKKVVDNKTVYHCIDVFCCFNCVYAELLCRLGYPQSIYKQSMVYLSSMYETMTGEDINSLTPSMDKRFLKVYNGNLTHTEFHKETGKYVLNHENIILLPAIQLLESNI